MSLNLITVSISFQFLAGSMSTVTLVKNDFLETYYHQIVHREYVCLHMLMIFLYASLTT